MNHHLLLEPRAAAMRAAASDGVSQVTLVPALLTRGSAVHVRPPAHCERENFPPWHCAN